MPYQDNTVVLSQTSVSAPVRYGNLVGIDDERGHNAQVTVLWNFGKVDGNGNDFSSKTFPNWYDPYHVPANLLTFDQTIKQIVIDPAFGGTTFMAEDGTVYTRPALAIAEATPVLVSRSQDVSNASQIFGAGSRITSKSLNNAVGQVFDSVQELTSRVVRVEGYHFQVDPHDVGGGVGPAGPQGPQGIQGETGPAGPQGIQGVQGPTGPQGVEGPSGTSVVLKGAVQSIGDLPAGATIGDLWVVLDDGNGYVWDGVAWDNAGPIQGPEGPQGPAGPEGVQGVQGPEGPQGPAGSTGPAGESIVGPTGPTGPTGPQGLPGDDGADGPAVTIASGIGVPPASWVSSAAVGDFYVRTG